jgi:hypothetical protein
MILVMKEIMFSEHMLVVFLLKCTLMSMNEILDIIAMVAKQQSYSHHASEER